MVDIGNLGGTFGWPSDLNNRGQVVGAMNLAGDAAYHPFSWERGELKDLGTFGRDCGVANAVNEGGEIAGWACDQRAAVFAFRWKNGVMANLGTVGGDPCSVANGINSEGQVVGESTPSPQCNFSPNDDRAVLWENGSAVDLNTLIPTGSGLELAVAFSINDRGEIDGNAVFPNGDMHAFVLIPCDEDHPGLEGCDYSLVDVTVQPSPSQLKPSPAVAGMDRPITQALDRPRSGHGRQYRYSGPTPPPR
jgi:probable HAF family extracellular repeat protein